ncbi:MAG: nuclear transport factor 2 family protein [cyanobacterium endosymbiont of Rhopalodia musculus]|uniref:nuclear transport factor 2 family protein n=1 Tax=cyanobacterium endosymbiont of Epithemia clementina EcSB TaxID=3034674 RepID=UPI0024804F57|nr:nuclear transport factor 2 family protein [cyanobacterium endosymbiont of Epithemia clementina EcSB]WGT67107.1 nuclear transport factor 2 family protein [cyanobacterium endosymbiont of Epithemia clementina EcSB]
MIQLRWFLFLMLSVGLSLGSIHVPSAESADSVPDTLKSLIEKINTAANSRDSQKLMALYGDQFATTDGLTAESFSKALISLWENYPNLQYTTKLQSWDKTEKGWTAKTLTIIEGSSEKLGRVVQLKATIKACQTFQNGKLLHQEILTERTELNSGPNPPKVEVKLPDIVQVGEKFDFDVIVQEPLNEDLLAGTAISERVDSDRYLDPGVMKLELLQAGGLFKEIIASEKPENRWLSALLVRKDGITLVTQRVRFQ